jgi:hypothetical protein
MLKECKNNECHKKIATATPEGTRKKGKPRKRWMYEVEED